MYYPLPRVSRGMSTNVIRAGACLMLASLSACSSLGSSGPSGSTIKSAGGAPVGSGIIQVLDVTEGVARQAAADSRGLLFSQMLGDLPPEATVVGRGDTLEISIWEAPPAVLFGSSATFGASDSSSILASSAGVSQRTALPEMMVDSDGMIRVPFAAQSRQRAAPHAKSNGKSHRGSAARLTTRRSPSA